MSKYETKKDKIFNFVDKPVGRPRISEGRFIFCFPKSLRKKCALICINRPGQMSMGSFVREAIEEHCKKNKQFIY